MKKLDLAAISLPKWPAFIVVGKPVTKDQAAEIIVRTCGVYIHTNDHNFERQAYDVLGVAMTDDHGYKHADYASVNRVHEALQVLELEYCKNNRIASCWIGGPHGWVDWNGSVGCNSFNIGKWPSATTVFEEWKKIAKAFPYLDLTCQLWCKETGEEDGKPVVEFRVKKGKVTAHAPKSPINVPADMSVDKLMSHLLASTGERGCTIEQLEKAVAITKAAIKKG